MSWKMKKLIEEKRTLMEWFGFCRHIWNEKDHRDILQTQTKVIVGSTSKLKCKKCGKIKFIKHFIYE